MKKKTLYNIIMVVVILAVALSGVLYVGHIKGWFSKNDGTFAILTEQRGLVNLKRSGVSFDQNSDIVLKNGDTIKTAVDSTCRVKVAKGYLTLGLDTKATVKYAEVDRFEIEILSGEVFVNAQSKMKLVFCQQSVDVKYAVCALSVDSSLQTLSVFEGEIDSVKSGQKIKLTNLSRSVERINQNNISDFVTREIKLCGKNITLGNENQNSQASENVVSSASKPSKTTDNSTVSKPSEKHAVSKPSVLSTPSASSTDEKEYLSCTVGISCETILENMDKLDKAKVPYVPDNGVILSPTTVKFTKGETAFDVLKRVCEQKNIQLEYSFTPMYNSYYVEGVNNLYEFDCGAQSGWVFTAGDEISNYGASSYTLVGGEKILLHYTCAGFGNDVGKK